MTQENKEKVIKVYILADIIEGYLIDLQPYTSQKFKQDINLLIRQSKKLTKFVDRNLEGGDQENFGNLADKFRERFDTVFNINEKDNG